MPGLERSLDEGNGTFLQYFCWKFPWAEESGGLSAIQCPRESDMTEQQRTHTEVTNWHYNFLKVENRHRDLPKLHCPKNSSLLQRTLNVHATKISYLSLHCSKIWLAGWQRRKRQGRRAPHRKVKAAQSFPTRPSMAQGGSVSTAAPERKGKAAQRDPTISTIHVSSQFLFISSSILSWQKQHNIKYYFNHI